MVLDRAHLHLGRGGAYARSQPRDGDNGIVASPSFQEQRIVLAERQIYVSVVNETKARRQDSHNDIAGPVQDQELAERLRVRAEAVFPQTMADDDHRRPAAPVFLERELTAKTWLDAKRAEEPRSQLDAIEMFRRTRSRQVIALVQPNRRHVLERACAALPIDKIRVGNRVLRDALVALQNHDEALRLEIWQRRQNHAPHHAEHRSVCANAQGERENRNRAKAGIFSQDAQAEAQILPTGFYNGFPPRGPQNFLRALDGSLLQAHSAKRILAARSLLHLFSSCHLKVAAKLLIQLLLDPSLSEQRSKASCNISKQPHSSPHMMPRESSRLLPFACSILAFRYLSLFSSLLHQSIVLRSPVVLGWLPFALDLAPPC